MRSQCKQMRAAVRGFSLIELAVVMSIVAFLLGSLMYTLSAQVEQRNFDDTRRRLEQARELLLGFAIVNRRLPCPARYVSDVDHSSGGESFCVAATGACVVTTVQPTHGRCSNSYDGYLPAAALGLQLQDALKFAVDSWGNRLRYTVSATTWTGGTARFTQQHSSDPAAAWSITTTPADLVVCSRSPTVSTNVVCDANTSVTNQSTLVALVFSTGKNGALPCATCTDEAANTNGNELFVHHTPAPADAGGGEFDDQFTWITVGELYGKLIAAGVLP